MRMKWLLIGFGLGVLAVVVTLLVTVAVIIATGGWSV